jgi:hypothetical protein
VEESGRLYSLELTKLLFKIFFSEACFKSLLLITCLIGAGFIYRVAHNDIYKNS